MKRDSSPSTWYRFGYNRKGLGFSPSRWSRIGYKRNKEPRRPESVRDRIEAPHSRWHGGVDFADLLLGRGAWSPCPDPPARCLADLHDRGTVDFADALVGPGDWA